MAEIVGGFAVSHSSLMVTRPDLVASEVAERCFAAYEAVRESITALRPDALIVVGSDHFNTFSCEAMPQWCIGRGNSHAGWADNIPMYTIPGDPALSQELLESLLRQGFEPSFSDSMRLDHSFFGPLHFLTPAMNVPVIPIFQNCIMRPFLTLARAYALGVALAAAITTSLSEKRIVIVGSGGLSHWIGGPKHGRLSPEFDREFLARFMANDVEWLTSQTDDLEQLAGNGGQEIRNWLTVRGALAHGTAQELLYEPAYPWIVGVGVAALSV
jgi:aromatic ring-opening dioxygenase catalytic subunit (LigB family)